MRCLVTPASSDVPAFPYLCAPSTKLTQFHSPKPFVLRSFSGSFKSVLQPHIKAPRSARTGFSTFDASALRLCSSFIPGTRKRNSQASHPRGLQRRPQGRWILKGCAQNAVCHLPFLGPIWIPPGFAQLHTSFKEVLFHMSTKCTSYLRLFFKSTKSPLIVSSDSLQHGPYSNICL